MRRRTKAFVGVAVVAAVAFTFLAPSFYWFTAYSPIVSLSAPPTPIFKAYRSLGCMFFGYGDAYYTASVTFSTNGQSMQNMQGLVFTCQPPILPV